ncbi:hypothetical protein ACWGAN_07345 [Streptomyces sp. NPDC054945]
MSGSWERAIAELCAQGLAARASAGRVSEIGADLRQRTTAAAVHYASEADYLRSALALLRAHLADGQPPRRLPAARVWPRPIRDLWKDRVLERIGGLWQTVPGAAVVDQMRSAPASPLLDAVIEQAEALQASLHGHRRHPRMYEKCFPERDGGVRLDGGGRPAPTVPGFPDPGHASNTAYSSSPPPAKERPCAWGPLKTAARTRSDRWMPPRERSLTTSGADRPLGAGPARTSWHPHRGRQPACR